MALLNPEDVKSDLNGTFQKCHEAKCITVQVSTPVESNFVFKIRSRKKELIQSNEIYMQINKRETEFGLIRNIIYFIDGEGKILNNGVILQYIINKRVAGDVETIQFSVKFHGNSSGGVFHPLKKSTLQIIKERATVNKKRNSSELYDSFFHENNTLIDYGDRPRSKKIDN